MLSPYYGHGCVLTRKRSLGQADDDDDEDEGGRDDHRSGKDHPTRRRARKLQFICERLESETDEMPLAPRAEKEHDDTCHFLLNPTLRPTSAGNITPPNVDWLLRNLFYVRDAMLCGRGKARMR